MQFSSVKTWKHKPGGAGASPHLIVCVVARWRSCWASELLSSATKQIWSLAACHEEGRVTSQGDSWDLQIWSLVDLILLTVLTKCEMSYHVRSSCIPHCLEIPQVLHIPRQRCLQCREIVNVPTASQAAGKETCLLFPATVELWIEGGSKRQHCRRRTPGHHTWLPPPGSYLEPCFQLILIDSLIGTIFCNLF